MTTVLQREFSIRLVAAVVANIFYLVLALSACTQSAMAPADPPVTVTFDTPLAEIVGGVRLAPPEERWDGYGEAVDVHGDLLVIGAPEWNHAADGRGEAYVYRFLNGGWQEEARLTASDRDEGQRAQRFGDAVALGEGMIAVGASGNDDPQAGENAGAVYLFAHEGQAWIEAAKLAPGASDRDNFQSEVDWPEYGRMRPRSFGALVALDGDKLAVGGDSATDAVYVFRQGEEGWQEQARIPIPDKPGRDLYMASLDLIGDTLALSAFYVPPQPEQELLITGNVVVYLFERSSGVWEETLRFTPEGAGVDLQFLREVNIGASVALGREFDEANLLAIGLPGFPDWSRIGDEEVATALFGANGDVPEFPESEREAGAVIIFERKERGDWRQQATLRPAGWDNPPGPGSSFPQPIPATHGEGGQDGLDQATSLASFVFPGHLLSEEPEVSFFGATVDLDGNQLAVTAAYANATYVFERHGQDWVYQYSITPRNEKMELWEDSAQVVRIGGDTLLLGTPSEFGNSAHVFTLPPTAD